MQFMEQHDVPERAIEKDLSLVESRLKNRRIRFGNGVTIQGRADNFEQKVQVEEEEEEDTLVRIFASIEDQK